MYFLYSALQMLLLKGYPAPAAFCALSLFAFTGCFRLPLFQARKKERKSKEAHYVSKNIFH